MHLFKKLLVSACLTLTAGQLAAAEAVLHYLDFNTGTGTPLPQLRKVAEAAKVRLEITPPDKLASITGGVLLVPESESFPASAVPGLEHYLKSGGSVIFTGGGRPFSASAVRDGGKFISRETYERHLKENAKGADTGAISPKLTYIRQCDEKAAKVPGSAKVSKDRVLHIECPEFSAWDNWATPDNTAKIPAGTGLLRLRARGDGKLPAFTVELREQDGSRWVASLPLEKEYTTQLLPPVAFRYWRSTPDRGKPGDQVNFNKVASVIFGISSTHAPGVRSGESYRYEIAQLDALPQIPDRMQEYPASFSLEGIAPTYKSYRLDGPVELTFSDSEKMHYPEGVISPVPRVRGSGIGMNRPWRFLPLAVARNRQGGRAYPVWIMLQLDREYKGSVVGGMGFPLDRILKTPELNSQLTGLIRRMADGRFLAAAGPEQFIADQGSRIRCGAKLFRPAPDCTVKTVWTAPDGSTPANSEFLAVTAPGTWYCRTELLDASGKVLDRIDSELNVPESKPADPAELVRVEGGDFFLGGEKWYPVGVNFYPVYSVAGAAPADYKEGWGSRRFYDPEFIDEAICDAKRAGINMLSVHPSDDNRIDPAAIRDFLYRCRKHGMKVNLFLGEANPVDFKESQLRERVDSMKLPQEPALFCYDIVWEASNFLFRNDFREKFLPEWNLWVNRQYGSADAAVRDWQFDPGKTRGGLRVPTDRELSADGPHRIYVAAYRQFMDDHTGKLWQHAADTLRTFDPNHPVTNRGGNLSPHDNSLSGTVRALDFLSPEGYAVRGNRAGEGAIGFATRLIGYYSGGKPVVWSEFGRNTLGPASFDASEAICKEGAVYNEMFYRRVLEAGAQGITPWWWPGGYRVNENSDYGISGIDGTLREAGMVTKRFSEPFRTPRERRTGKTFFDYDRDAASGGYHALAFGDGGKAYLDAVEAGDMLEIRTPATGRTSVDVPVIGVGNVPYTGHNPVRYLNGAFDKVEYRKPDGNWALLRDGGKVQQTGALQLRVTIGNSGEVPFAAVPGSGGVEVTAEFNGGKAAFPLASELPRMKTAELDAITIPAEASGTVSLRFAARGRAVFGEHFQFQLAR